MSIGKKKIQYTERAVYKNDCLNISADVNSRSTNFQTLNSRITKKLLFKLFLVIHTADDLIHTLDCERFERFSELQTVVLVNNSKYQILLQVRELFYQL